MTWIRAISAAILSVILPGAGHAMLRDWARALLFGGLFALGIYFFVPTGDMMAAESMTEMVETMNAETSTVNQFFLMFIVLFAAIDSTFRALGFPPNGSQDTDGPTCPSCGKELDDDLTFCHWCTTRLETPEEDTETI
ncbi:zinc ribbon domain-containing protein [Halostagnicola sp. A-GB9-2]|uniref:zinc ribbon domain-containing protein n=1 Tax=Halostagnicola sp. A-GB9-2 TaxID=3048066 RepID=UPI0024BFF000|nr:zinc ribbon domain-containing protein [Halostagnicola sp. A-GB9-2]MDJ1431085.1 zinc ribbon domain-containing protein [Halostagnicola sp. A-GB9-2]